MSDSLSLYDLSAELVRLMNAWDETEGNERVFIETELQLYVDAQVKKVDDIRAFLVHCQVMADAADLEAARQKRNAKAWQARYDRLKNLCQYTMERFEVKRLDGKTGSLLLKGNGGKQPVEITNPELVPDEFCVYEGAIPVRVWDTLIDFAHIAFEQGAETPDFSTVQVKRVVRKGLIEAEMQKPCEACKGIGAPWNNSASVPCSACGGTGRRGVPGCRLGERRAHLEIR